MITVEQFLAGIDEVYKKEPKYRTGGDGSDGTCDCIGLPRGVLTRAGENVKNMGGTNQAARKTILNLQKIKKAGQLKKGDVVLKTRDKDDPNMKLPDRYRKGGVDYNATWGEINFTHIGVVTNTDPLEITHMTSPTVLKDTKLGKWEYFGQLPWVTAEAVPDQPEEPEVMKAVVIADSGKTVKMRDKPSSLCRLYWDVPIGSEVILMKQGDKWSEIIWQGRSGYMMTQYLNTNGITYAVIIPGLPESIADEICSMYVGAYKEMERG